MNKRILLVTRNFPPLTGGMERLNHHLYLELEKEFEVLVAGPNGCQNYLSPETSYCLFPYKPVSLFLLKSFIATYCFAVKQKPNLIIAGSGVTALAALLAGRRIGAKVMVFLHGLDILYPHPIYQGLFLPAIRACDGFWVNSNHTARLAQSKGIAPEKIQVLHPGVTIPSTENVPLDSSAFRKSFSISDDNRVLLSVGRLTERKGLPEFIRHCLPRIAAEFPTILLVIIGNEAADALSKQISMLAHIQQAAVDAKMENHVRLLGQVSETDLALAYNCSELLVFPVLDLPGDLEGFGMVAVEAAAHGLPTAAFAVGGVTDAVSDHCSGWLVNSGDYTKLSEVINEHLRHPVSGNSNKAKVVTKARCKQHAAQFSWQLFGEKLRQSCL